MAEGNYIEVGRIIYIFGRAKNLCASTVHAQNMTAEPRAYRKTGGSGVGTNDRQTISRLASSFPHNRARRTLRHTHHAGSVKLGASPSLSQQCSCLVVEVQIRASPASPRRNSVEPMSTPRRGSLVGTPPITCPHHVEIASMVFLPSPCPHHVEAASKPVSPILQTPTPCRRGQATFPVVYSAAHPSRNECSRSTAHAGCGRARPRPGSRTPPRGRGSDRRTWARC